MKQSAILAITLIALGLGLTIGSKILDSPGSAWWSATLGNAGITVFLAVPIAFFLSRINTNVENTRKEVRSVEDEVKQFELDLVTTREQVRDLREAARSSAKTQAEYRAALYEAGTSDDSNFGDDEFVDMISDATSTLLISGRGFRSELGAPGYYLKCQRDIFSLRGVELTVQDATAVTLYEVSLHPFSKSLVELLADIQNFVVDRGGDEYDPAESVYQIRRDLSHLRYLRRFKLPGKLDSARQLFNGDWVFCDAHLVHVLSSFTIPYLDLLKRDWVSHLRATCDWFDVYGELAVRSAQAQVKQLRT